MSNERDAEFFDTVIIGGGQAGLTAGYYLAKHGRSFVILDANERIGDAWRKRWDSLRLFTPACFSGLPGYPLPAPAWSFPTKDELADYLEAYVARFELPVRTGIAVDGLSKANGRFVVSAGERRFEAANVIVATGAHQIPKVPVFAPELDPRITQLHSRDYRGPSQLQEGDVLLVGAGNSGAEIATELSRTHRCFLAGPRTGEIPVRHGTLPARFGFRVFRFLGHHVLRADTRLGRKFGPKLISKGDPLIRTKLKDLVAAGVERAFHRHVRRPQGVEALEPRVGSQGVVDDDAVERESAEFCRRHHVRQQRQGVAVGECRLRRTHGELQIEVDAEEVLGAGDRRPVEASVRASRCARTAALWRAGSAGRPVGPLLRVPAHAWPRRRAPCR